MYVRSWCIILQCWDVSWYNWMYCYDVCEKLMHHITMLRCIVIQSWMYCYDVCEKLMHHSTMLGCIVIQCWMYCCDVCEKLMHHITVLRCIVMQCWMYCCVTNGRNPGRAPQWRKPRSRPPMEETPVAPPRRDLNEWVLAFIHWSGCAAWRCPPLYKPCNGDSRGSI